MKEIDSIEKGSCTFTKEARLSSVIKHIPLKYGVYIFHKNQPDGDILYIGKGGTINQNGKFKEQKLRERIKKKHMGLKSQELFLSKMKKDKTLHQIVIEWHVLDEKKYLPAFVEAQLIQEYYLEHKCLPIWNNAF